MRKDKYSFSHTLYHKPFINPYFSLTCFTSEVLALNADDTNINNGEYMQMEFETKGKH